jgi:hypothetical protein
MPIAPGARHIRFTEKPSGQTAGRSRSTRKIIEQEDRCKSLAACTVTAPDHPRIQPQTKGVAWSFTDHRNGVIAYS